MNTRRTHIVGLITMFLSACSTPTSLGMGNTISADDKNTDTTLKYKFRGVVGAELSVSATYRTSTSVIRLPNGYLFNIGYGVFGPKARSVSFYSGLSSGNQLVIPPYLRYQRFPEGAKFIYTGGVLDDVYVGTPLIDITVPVAERIPDDLLEDLRRDPKGTLRLKLRIHPDTLLVGWDIERRPNPWGFTQSEITERNIAIPAAWSHTGGDFKEARVANYSWEGDGLNDLPPNIPVWNKGIPEGQHPWKWQGFISLPTPQQLGYVVPQDWAKKGLYISPIKKRWMEKGWYIDPRTKERIETDF